MYKVVTRQKEFYKLVADGIQSLAALKNVDVYEKVLLLIQCLNLYYGADRDLEKDLGGYVVLVYGDSEEIKSTYEKILAYHHLHSDNYEFEDIFQVSECSTKVTFRLFLCSPDYSVEIVTFEEDMRR